MQLDMSSPYGIVSGLPGICYQQNGRYFGRNGQEMADPEGGLAPPIETKPEPPKREPMRPDDLRNPENKRLKAMLEVYGEPWTTAREARLFLEGKG